MKKILNIIFIIFIIFIIATLGSKLFAYDYYIVTSDSMYPQVPKYSLVYIKTKNFEINEGDIIAFHSGENQILHRIKEINDDAIITHGDNNPEGIIERITQEDIIGVKKFHVPYIGFLFLNSYLWIIIALLLISYLIIIKLIKEIRK